MEGKEDLVEIKKKIRNERKKLDNLVLEGLEKQELLELSCKLDELINEYYRIAFRDDKDPSKCCNK